jgi:citrate synthase
MRGDVGDDLYMTADAAARMLGVSAGTLYAYVSRKGLRSFPIPGSRKRLYWRADIEALRRPEHPVAASACLARTTSLTLLTDAGLFYRGGDATLMAGSDTLETVAALLWNVDAAVFDGPIDRAPAALPELLRLLAHLPPVDGAISILPTIEHENPRSADLSPSGFSRTSASVLRWFAALIVRGNKASHEPVHRVIARSSVPDGRFDDLVRRTLVLAADHELDPTAYVVRAAGNVGCTPYGAALAGLVASRGQRLRHQRTLATERFVREVVASSEPEKEVARLYRLGEPLPGFTPLVEHSRQDPRAQALLGAMRIQLEDDPDFLRLDRAITAAADLTGVAAHFILPVTFLGLQLGYAGEPLTFSAPGRLVGWLAQALEQYEEGPMIRPRAAYVGVLPAKERGV